jgi:hypothetical protein
MRADILERLTAERGYLVALGATFADMAANLRARWPSEVDVMPFYQVFRGE